MKLTNGSKIGKANIIVDILPKGKVSTQQNNTQTSITIHNTGVWNVAAKNFNSGIKQNNNGGREASWHFTVDDQFIYQHIDTAHEAYHTGVGAKGNETSIGIEICMFKDEVKQKLAEDNAVALVRYLRKNVKSIAKIMRHYDWSKKHCPCVLMDRPNGWEDFLAACNKKEVVAPVKPKFKRLLQYTSPMMKGDDVKVVQKTLNIKADGIFGKDTRQAVINFQRKHNLKGDGIVGKKTWGELF